jgi:hypothetical protein
MFAAIIVFGSIETFEGLEGGLLFLAVYVWMVYGTWLLPFKEAADPPFRQIRGAMIRVPVAMAALFAYGYTNGASDLRRTASVYSIQLKHGDPLHRLILRNVEKGLLVRDIVKNEVEFIRWDEVSRVGKITPDHASKPIVCKLFGWRCDFVAP